jgi:methylenetetrahydrofolate dehydrogenase (NADP+)/methenyltetrahydrofolate cyclohydrolase
MATILDGKKVAAEIRAEVADAVQVMVAAGARPPGLTAVLVGDNPASHVYVGSKVKACREAGIVSQTLELPASVSADELTEAVQGLNADDAVDGILIQLPLPDGLPERAILEQVDPSKDVDGFHPENIGRLWADEAGFVPATPAGIMEMLRRYEIPLSGRNAVVVGRSLIVGKPMAGLLLRENCTVTICHSRTRNLPEVCRGADILVAAVGHPAMLGAEHVAKGAVVIDVGINRITEAEQVERLFPGDEKRRASFEKKGSTLVGDVDYTAAVGRASAITPVPGGVGPLTVAMVIANTLTASRRRQGLDSSRSQAQA